MRYAKPLLRFLSLRHVSYFLCLSLLLAAVALGLIGSADAKKGAAPAKGRTKAAPARSTPQTTCAGGQRSGAACVGEWGPLKELRTMPVHISLLPDSRLLYWGRDKVPAQGPGQEGRWWDETGRSETYTWNPLNGADPLNGPAQRFPNSTTNLFCSGHSFLPDGRLLVTGGHIRDNRFPLAEGIGAKDVNIFDYRNNTWALAMTPPAPGATPRPVTMSKGRWYPSNVTLASGETVIFSGGYWDGSTLNEKGQPAPVENPIPEIYQLDGALRAFTVSRPIPIYPYLHLAPHNGQVFIAGPGPDASRYFEPYADPDLDGKPEHFVDDVADFDPTHLNGTSVLYDSVRGKVMMIGGHVFFPGDVLSEVRAIDLSESPPKWRPATPVPGFPTPPPDPQDPAPMNHRRKYPTATILPDGTVLVTGGTECQGGNSVVCAADGTQRCRNCNYGNGVEICQHNEKCKDAACVDCANRAVTRPELWDPATNTWAVMAPNPSGVPRVYHSVALLLPDARVLVGGGGLPAAEGEIMEGALCLDASSPDNPPACVKGGHKDIEIFSPPYLFAPNGQPAVRPVILSAPDSVAYGQTFDVRTDAPAQVASAVLVRLPSVTHGINFDQRRVELLNPEPVDGSSVRLTMPTNSSTCPPGFYMLFVLNSAGVPSVADFVRVDGDAQPPPSPSKSLSATANAALHVELAWAASTGNVDHYEVWRDGGSSPIAENVTGTTYTDQTASSGAAHVYRVRAVGPSADPAYRYSGYSNPDIATTVVFKDDPLGGGVPIKAEHMTQLRQAVNAVRAAAGLPAANWTNPNLSGAIIKVEHIMELRTKLDEALNKIGLPFTPYTDPTLTRNDTLFKHIHWQQLRDRVR
jgi:hypothetical protein